MPKKLFFELPEEKRALILRVAAEEFSRREYHEASINQIVKAAGIARGSFYLYFEDKADLYFHLLALIYRQRLVVFFKAQGGTVFHDIFALHAALFHFNLTLLAEPANRALFKNHFLSMDERFSRQSGSIVENARKELLAALEPECHAEDGEILELLQLIGQQLLATKVLEELSDEEILQRYRRKVRYLCHTDENEKRKSKNI